MGGEHEREGPVTFHVSETIAIARPAEDVFTFVADLRNFPLWRANLRTSTLVSEHHTQVGARCIEEMQIGPRTIPGTCRIVTYSEGRTFSFQAVSPGLTYDGRVVVEREPSGCVFTLGGDVRITGLLRLLEPMIHGRMQDGVETEAARIKALMEAPHATATESARHSAAT
jgi:uncharacterized membrane protein